MAWISPVNFSLSDYINAHRYSSFHEIRQESRMALSLEKAGFCRQAKRARLTAASVHAEAAFGSGRARLLARVPEGVLDRGQYICNQAHLIYAFDDEY